MTVTTEMRYVLRKRFLLGLLFVFYQIIQGAMTSKTLNCTNIKLICAKSKSLLQR
jgi:hypothetical protein